MKVSLIVFTLAAALSGLTPAIAVPPPAAPLPPLSATPPSQQPISVAEGKVRRLLINPFGEVDGLQLESGVVVAFPPHMGARLAAEAAPGQSVRISGFMETAKRVKAESIINVATGQALVDRPPTVEDEGIPPHLRANTLQRFEVSGSIDTVLTGPRGEINGTILNDGSIVHFPPGSLQRSLEAGMPFAAAGLGTRNQYGQALEAVSVGATLSSLQPLYRGEP